MDNEEWAIEVESGPAHDVEPLRDDGPHALALAHLFDQIVGDAYHARLGRLCYYGPEVMARELRLRADLTPGGNVTSVGVVVLDHLPEDLGHPQRIYWIRRRGKPMTSLGPEWKCLAETDVLTPKVQWWGIWIRLSGIFNRLDWLDRAMAKMRREFSIKGHGRGQYQLSIWTRSDPHYG
ncbi:MAG: hypothetical protein M1600_13875 [Firmicutes bacterium]|jgi:hypothetical protein|nr:hypothetical protein [Bacillota bacterium]